MTPKSLNLAMSLQRVSVKFIFRFGLDTLRLLVMGSIQPSLVQFSYQVAKRIFFDLPLIISRVRSLWLYKSASPQPPQSQLSSDGFDPDFGRHNVLKVIMNAFNHLNLTTIDCEHVHALLQLLGRPMPW